MMPYVIINVADLSLYINNTKLKQYGSITEALTAQYLLHQILNLKYSSANYYHTIELSLGLLSKAPKASTKALVAFLSIDDIYS